MSDKLIEEALAIMGDRPCEEIIANTWQHVFNEPLSLPENRTEDEHLALLHWLEATTQSESRCIGTQADENGVEHEVWQHTFTPEYWHRPTPIRSIDAMRGSYRIKASARMRKQERARKIKARQRRAAQRRRNRGMR